MSDAGLFSIEFFFFPETLHIFFLNEMSLYHLCTYKTFGF